MDPSPLHPSLLRPPTLQILRAVGFTTTRPSVLDTLTDLASRHLLLLCQRLSHLHSLQTPFPLRPDSPPTSVTLTTVRLAMQEIGTFYPSLSEMEEQMAGGEEDLRGVEAFISWCMGDVAREIRRIAEMESSSDLSLPQNPTVASTAAIATQTPKSSSDPTITIAQDIDTKPPDYLTQLKRKHAKTRDGEEARYAGTVLGRDRVREEEDGIKIEGWEVGTLREWGERLRLKSGKADTDAVEVTEVDMGEADGEGGGSGSSSPLSDISGEVIGV